MQSALTPFTLEMEIENTEPAREPEKMAPDKIVPIINPEKMVQINFVGFCLAPYFLLALIDTIPTYKKINIRKMQLNFFLF